MNTFFLFAVAALPAFGGEHGTMVVSASGPQERATQTGAGAMTIKKIASEAPLPTMPLPRNPQVAVQEEFEAAKAQGTREAYDLFIARHPESRFTPEAKRLRERSPSKR
jgi:hypothetical protein